MRLCVLLSLVVSLSLLALPAASQAIGLLRFDTRTRRLERLPAVPYDTTLQQATTSFFRGHTGRLTALANRLPTTNALPNTQFSIRQRAASAVPLLSYPVSTAVRLTGYQQGAVTGQASGTLVGERFVLTAAHNVAQATGQTLLIASDSVLVEPVLDNGRPAPLPAAWAYRYYIPATYDEQFRNDLCLLELAAPIGRTTGWLSIGFNKDRSWVGQQVWHKFSYPVIDISGRTPYNGDTLYYEFGQAQASGQRPFNISVPNHSDGAGGQSGSSLFVTDNASYWTIYATLTFSGNFEHTGLSPATYHAFSQILRAALVLDPGRYVCYPNPVQDILFVQVPATSAGPITAELFDAVGRRVHTGSYTPIEGEISLDLHGLRAGLYVLQVTATPGRQRVKVIKQ